MFVVVRISSRFVVLVWLSDLVALCSGHGCGLFCFPALCFFEPARDDGAYTYSNWFKWDSFTFTIIIYAQFCYIPRT